MAELKTIVIANDWGKEKNLVLHLTPAQYALFQLFKEKDLLNDTDHSFIDLNNADIYEFTEPSPETELIAEEEK